MELSKESPNSENSKYDPILKSLEYFLNFFLLS